MIRELNKAESRSLFTLFEVQSNGSVRFSSRKHHHRTTLLCICTGIFRVGCHKAGLHLSGRETLWKKIIKQNSNSFKIQTVCMNECGVDGTACAEIVQGNATLKVDIEKTTTRYIQRYTLIETLVPAIMCLFVGPYSDEHGRKLPIVSQIIDHHAHKFC